MKAKISFFSVVFCCTWLVFAITSINDHSFGFSWSKTFGGAADDWGYSVQQTDDGGFIIGGYTYSFGSEGLDFYLIKTDASGNETWSKTFGGGYSPQLWHSKMFAQQTDDFGFVIVGSTMSFGAGGADVYLIKTDASGNEMWSKTFGGAYDDFGYSVQQTDDSGFIIAGYTYSFGGGAQVYLIKTDASGNEMWAKTFGGGIGDISRSVQQTSDGGFIIAGYTGALGAAGADDVYLIKTDAVNDRLNRASGDRRNGAISKGPKTISNSPFKLAFFTSFLG